MGIASISYAMMFLVGEKRVPKPVEDFGIGKVLGEFGLGTSETPGVFTDLLEPGHDYDIAEYPDGFNTELGDKNLPVYAFKAEIIAAVRDNPVTLIVAETGAGKSTQIPKFLLEQGTYKKIYLTQPRRAPTHSLFSRIDQELFTEWGDDGANLVSYQTAGGREGPRDAPVQIVTDGLQVAHEFYNKGIEEEDVLIIDEAHEWNTNMEMLVAIVKNAVCKNPQLRVVIMSATMDADRLADFYSQINDDRPPIINIPGRAYKIETSEQPSSTVVDEVMKIVTTIAGQGEATEGPNGILAFVPGKREIQDSINAVRSRLPKELAHKVKLFPLHAKLSTAEQASALTEYPGSIKIVFSTDVAQTSLTIPDIRYVVDSGYQKRIEIDSEGTRSLSLVPISYAEAMQRKGRTGRVGDGFYVSTCLNEDTAYVPLARRDDYPIPEILRTDASRDTLRLKQMGYAVEDFGLYHMPSQRIIKLAKETLRLLGAFDADNELTDIGREMNKYPAGASSARIMVEAGRYKPTTRSYLAAIVATKEAGGLQYYANNASQRWQELTQEDESDFLVQLDLFIAAQHMTLSGLRDYGLDIDNFKRAFEQYQKIAHIAGAPCTILEQPTEKEREDILRCLYTGYSPFIYKRTNGNEYVHAYRPFPTPREISNRSAVTGSPAFIIGDPYRIERLPDGNSIIPNAKHSIENVTRVAAHALGLIAVEHTVWEPVEYLMREDEGKMKQTRRQLLFGMPTDVVDEVPAEPSPATRQEVINYALLNPGYAQRRLRHIKDTLEQLDRKAKDTVPLLVQTKLLELVNEAAPDDITNPAQLEANLQAILDDPSRRLSLDDFVSEERRREIIANAPPLIEVGDIKIHLSYARNRRSSVVTATRYNPNQVMQLVDEVFLADGRQVLFTRRNDSRRYTLHELKGLHLQASS